jgi:hypothetical protein
MLVASDFAMPTVDAGWGTSDVDALLLVGEGSDGDTEKILATKRRLANHSMVFTTPNRGKHSARMPRLMIRVVS